MYPVTARFLDTIAGSHRAVVRVQVLSVDTMPQFGPSPTGGTELPVLDGDVKLSSTQDINGSCDFTISGDYWDVLQPYGAELFVERGIDYGDGTREFIPCGYYGIEEIAQDKAPAGPVRVSGFDRSQRLKRNRVVYPIQFPAGTTHTVIFDRLVNGITPGSDTLKNYPMFMEGDVPMTFAGYDPDNAKIGSSLTCEDDPHAFLAKIADAKGSVLRFDRHGELVVQLSNIPPGSTAPVYVIRPGMGGNLIGASRKVTRDGVYNYVVARGSNPANPTGHRLAYNDDEDSPLRWYGPFGVVTRYYASPLLLTSDAADAAAETVLSRYRGLPSSLALLAVPNPALDPLDVVQAQIGSTRADHLIDQVSIPLVGSSPVQIVTRTLNEVIVSEEDTTGGGGSFPNPPDPGAGGGTGDVPWPTNFAMTVTNRQATVSWTVPAGVDAIEVHEFLADPLHTWKVTVQAPGTTWTSPALGSGREYLFAVRSIRDGVYSEFGDRIRILEDFTTVNEGGAGTPPSGGGGGGGGTGGVEVGQTTIFTDDFTSIKYDSTAEPASYSINIVNDGPGHESVIRFEVREGDDWNGAERSEVTIDGDYDVSEGDERWYEFDLKIGEPFGPVQDEAKDGTVIFQWHPEDQEASPPMALAVSTTDKLRFTWDAGDYPPLDMLDVPYGEWMHVVMHLKFSQDDSEGFVQCHVDGQQVLPLTHRPTMTDASNYHKFGIYRDTDTDSTDVVMYDNLRISGPPATTPSGGGGGGGGGGGATDPTMAAILRLGAASGLTKANLGVGYLPNDGPGDGGGAGVVVGQTTEFEDDFATLSYSSTAEPGSHSINIANGGTGHETSARFEVREGDDWNGAERAEVTIDSDYDVSEGDERWYEFDLRIGTPFGPVQDETKDGTVIFQWHPEDQDASPPMALAVSTTNKLRFTWDAGDYGPLDFWDVRPGVWEHVVMHLKFSQDDSEGFAQVHINGQEVLPLTHRPTMTDAGNYHKFGIYRDTDTDSTDVVWYDNLRISSPPATTPSGGGGTGQGAHVDYTLAQIENDLELPGYADIRTDVAAVRLTSYVGASTTPGTSSARTEYRELATNGTSLATWSSTSGRHYVWCRGSIIRLAPGRPHMVIAQMLDASAQVASIRVEGTNVVSTFGSSGRPGTLATGVTLGSVHEWMIEVVSSGSLPPATQAAQLIRDRMLSGQAINEDWTWSGAPAVVGTYNDQLLSEWEAAGQPDEVTWLNGYIASHGGGAVPPATQAAQLIRERMLSGQTINEDWTWSGAPAVVGQYNDTLLAEWEDDGSPDEVTWLSDYIAANSGGGAARINYYWDNMTTPVATQSYAGGAGNFFRFGNHNQSTTSLDSADDSFVLDLFDAEVWHTGYPSPTPRHSV